MIGTVKPGTQVSIDQRLAALRVQLMAGETAKRFGQRMAQRRLELGLKQREVAKRIQDQVPEMGADKQRVSDWERGVNVPSDPYKPAIVKALEVPDIGYFYETPDVREETPDPFADAAKDGDGTRDQQLAELRQDVADLKEQVGQLVGLLTGDPAKTAILSDALVKALERALSQRAREAGKPGRPRPPRPPEEEERPAA